MKLLDKKQLNTLFGKRNSFSNIESIKYMGGIDVFDKVINAKTGIIYLDKRPKGLEINLSIGFKNNRIGLYTDSINYWSIENKKDLLVKKKKSVLGRALFGGLLLGPAGAIVGGLTGIGDKTTKLNDIDNVVSISYNEDGKEKIFLFSCMDKKLKKAHDYFKSVFPDLYISSDDLKDESHSTSNDIADLEKLAKLKDKGIITEDEFNAKKKSILGI